MATFEATTTPMTFAHMEGEVKTVHVVPRTRSYDMVTAGDRIEFDPLGSITLGAIRRYDTLDELMKAEGFQNIAPDAETVEEAMAWVRDSPEWSTKVEEASGVMALRVRSIKRKS